MMIALLVASLMLAQAPPSPAYKTIDVSFRSQDGQEPFGKLTVPDGVTRAPVVLMVQTAEAQTADSRVQGPRGPIDFFDLYRRELAAMGVAFFSDEGRGIRLGDKPPRYVAIDRALFNTATLERKVQVHGEIAGNTPVAGVRRLQQQATASGKTKIEFHYFADEEHSLGGLDFFLKGAPSDGYKELFAYVKRQIAP